MKNYLVKYRKNNNLYLVPVLIKANSKKEAKEKAITQYSMNGYHRIIVKSVTLV